MAASGSLVSKLFLLLIAALPFLMLLNALGPTITALQAVDLASSHAVARHGGSAIVVRNCLNDKGAMQTWFNPTTGRTARVCLIGDTTFGIQILEDVNETMREVTAFIKDKFTRVEQVAQYLKNRGYQPLQ